MEERQLRRKSTSAILFNPHSTDMNILNLTNILIESSPSPATVEKEEEVEENESSKAAKEEEKNPEEELPKEASQGASASNTNNSRSRNWDYFEINHPKAISDKKLQQLKEKYLRRKTEAVITITEEGGEEAEQGKKHPPPTRSNSVPSAMNKVEDLKKELKARAVASLEGSKRRTSSCSSSSNLEEIREQQEGADKVASKRIAPAAAKKLSVDVHSKASEDDGIGSLPQTPTDVLFHQQQQNGTTDDGICTNSSSSSSEEVSLGTASSTETVSTTTTVSASSTASKALLLSSSNNRRASSVEVADGSLSRRIEALLMMQNNAGRAKSVEVEDHRTALRKRKVM